MTYTSWMHVALLLCVQTSIFCASAYIKSLYLYRRLKAIWISLNCINKAFFSQDIYIKAFTIFWIVYKIKAFSICFHQIYIKAFFIFTYYSRWKQSSCWIKAIHKYCSSVEVYSFLIGTASLKVS